MVLLLMYVLGLKTSVLPTSMVLLLLGNSGEMGSRAVQLSTMATIFIGSCMLLMWRLVLTIYAVCNGRDCSSSEMSRHLRCKYEGVIERESAGASVLGQGDSMLFKCWEASQVVSMGFYFNERLHPGNAEHGMNFPKSSRRLRPV
jgi:hypothetical protein